MNQTPTQEKPNAYIRKINPTEESNSYRNNQTPTEYKDILEKFSAYLRLEHKEKLNLILRLTKNFFLIFSTFSTPQEE